MAREPLAEVAALLAAEQLKLAPSKTRVLRYDDTLTLSRPCLCARNGARHRNPAGRGRCALRRRRHRAAAAAAPPLVGAAAPARRVLPSHPERLPAPPAVAPAMPGEDTEPAEADPFAPGGDAAPSLTPRAGLRVLHVLGNGPSLDVRNQAFAVRGGGSDIFLVHHTRLDRVEIGPAADASGAALRFALEFDTPLAFTDGARAAVGMLAPRLSPDGALHLAQARLVLDPDAGSTWRGGW